MVIFMVGENINFLMEMFMKVTFEKGFDTVKEYIHLLQVCFIAVIGERAYDMDMVLSLGRMGVIMKVNGRKGNDMVEDYYNYHYHLQLLN